MNEEKKVQWFCHRCIKKYEVEVEPDPVLLRVCDGCQVENWTRPVKGAEKPQVELVPIEPEPVIEAETVEEELVLGVNPIPTEPEPEVTVKVKLDTEELDKTLDAKKAEITKLKAQLAELEK